MDGAGLRALVLEMARPSKALSREELRTMEKISVLMADFLDHKARSLISGAENRPSMITFGSDGTPLLSRKHFPSSWVGAD